MLQWDREKLLYGLGWSHGFELGLELGWSYGVKSGLWDWSIVGAHWQGHDELGMIHGLASITLIIQHFLYTLRIDIGTWSTLEKPGKRKKQANKI